MGSVKIEKVEYLGWENCVKISNGKVEAIVTTDVGPRIISYGFKGGPNHMRVFKDQAGKTEADEFMLYGGHRLWHSPEDEKRTCDKDNFSCEWEKIKDGIRIKSVMDPWVQTEKEMEIILDKDSTRLTINHRITNKNAWEIEFAVWALTVMDVGGREIIPQITDGPELLPNRTVSLWTYAKMNDPRVTWGDEYIFLDQKTDIDRPFKIGLPVTKGWAAYSNHNQLFVKHFDFIEEAEYPDFGYCSYETYTNPEFLEMESLSPLFYVAPEEHIEHAEVWELFDKVERPETEDDVRENILPLINKNY